MTESLGYYNRKFTKTTIVIHHTAGSHRPDWCIDSWKANKNKIGTSKVIGGKANTYKWGPVDEWDGVVVEYFDPKFWAMHLGIRESNYQISKASIGIEICNYGQLIKNSKGQYLTYVNSLVPEDKVCTLSTPFRGFTYFEAYTEKQILSLKAELLKLAEDFSIDLHSGLWSLVKRDFRPVQNAFDYQAAAISGKPGLWLHTNYRKADKWDCPPQPMLVDMILSL